MKKTSIFLSSHQSLALICTFFALWLTVFFEGAIESYFGYILIITIGILHGANDIKLIGFHNRKRKPRNEMHVLIRYILVVALSTIFFVFLPKIALGVFLIISSYHFGEQHWIRKVLNKSFLSRLYFTCYGLLIFGMVFYFNSEDTSNIIYNITDLTFTKSHYGAVVLGSLFSLVGLSIYGVLSKKFVCNWYEELFLLVVFALIFYLASLIWAFAIYFILWHSLPSLDDQIRAMYGANSKQNLIKYLKNSWLYWLISIIGLGLTLYFFKDQQELFHTIFFAFLAAITLPHVMVMNDVMQPSGKSD